MNYRVLNFLVSCLLSTGITYTFKSDDILQFFWANLLQYRGDHSNANIWYKSLFNQTSNPYIYKGYIPFLSETDQLQDIVQLIPSLDKKFENDVEIQQLFAQALLKTGKQHAAHDRFIRLNNQFKHDQAIAFQTATIYMSKKEPENALATIDNLLNSSPKKPNNFIFHFLKSQIYVQMNNPQKALDCIKICLSLAPSFDKAWLLFALLEEQAGSLTEAIKGFTTFLEKSDTKNHDIEQHLLQLIFKQKIALQRDPSLHANQPPSFTNALRLFEKKEYTTALAQIDQWLDKNPKDPESRLLKVQILTALNKHAQAADVLKVWILEDAHNEEWLQALYLLYKNGLPVQKAIAILEDVTQAQPQNITPILYLADLNTRINHQDTALIYYTKGVKLTDQPHLKTKLLYQMALIYHDKRNFNAMEKVLQEGYDLGLEFPPLLNLFAYHAAKSDNIENAHTLIQKALQADEKNPHFLETKALILYKQQEFDKALELLHTLIQELPNDFSVLTTLGKTYYKTGKRELALQTIQKAADVAHHADEKEQSKKILATWKLKKHE